MSVQSVSRISPGLCCWGNQISFSGPCCDFHARMRRCNVRSCPGAYLPGFLSDTRANSVTASSPGSRSSSRSISAQSSLNGSSRVLQFLSAGSSGYVPPFRYFLAVFLSIPAFIAVISTFPVFSHSQSSFSYCRLVIRLIRKPPEEENCQGFILSPSPLPGAPDGEV